MDNREYLIKEYLWFEYEGKIICETWNKCIRYDRLDIEEIIYKLKNYLVSEKDLREFYNIGMSVFNISNFVNEEWATKEILIERYKNNKKENIDHSLHYYMLEYLTWRYKDDCESFKLLLEKFENI